jgi:hypothetical protein
MDYEERLAKQVSQLAGTRAGTRGLFVYRNFVKAQPWYSMEVF